MLKQLCALLALITIASCKPKESKPIPDASKGTYFSIKQFVKDQWDIHNGQPYGLTRVVTLNGEQDSTMTTAYEMAWGPLFKMFFDTDISDPKYLGQYDFSMFEDDATYTMNYYYEAKDPKLFTRKLHISTDATNNKVRSIYIETQKNGKWSDKSQKLFYMPLKVISVQEFEKSLIGSGKELRIEYRFL
jgi:hypothetical protein